MKFIQLFCAFLLCLAIASASSLVDYNNPCSVTHKVVNTYMVENTSVTQYSVTITNHYARVIKSICIASSNEHLILRDGNAVYNVEVLPNGQFVLPSHLTIIEYGTYTFYFTITTTTQFSLYIKSIQF